MTRGLFPSGSVATAAVTEALADPADYLDRDGYDAAFLGAGSSFELPRIKAEWAADLAPVQCPRRPGELVHDLLYTHFSVLMSRSRRMPYCSCVNIDGSSEVPLARRKTPWRPDPRLPREGQLLRDGIYGAENDGLFSRGHMTRREDPNWGSRAVAKAADADTFHATNACPQFQPFNAPIWLALENHVKDNAWADDMRVSVFTGPIFDDKTDARYEPPGLPPVRVPLDFWKIVIFRHDVSGRPAATAYVASQAEQLPGRNRREFVFGRFREYQVRIADLQRRTRLEFPGLAKIDVLAGLASGLRLQHARLEDVLLRR